ncbi:type I polyketide synthase [Aspergillus stella-maris]|uniref:type I polyketide synthase n=1 Tax=Aspergillus stella-maris TaxID=1810926 RepID=UPI003CCE19F2
MPAQQNDVLPPLAIVGLSLKFPQDAVTSESFWDMIVQGRCAATEFPSDRLNIDAHYHPDSNRLDSLSVKHAHFMKEDLSLFDAPFFSITTTEAEAMDPQQRLVLETSYRALENAGITMEKLSRSKTCVFTGSFGHDYETIQNKDLQAMSKFSATGTSMNMQSNRVSWFFNLNGPSATVDTACSSSLMAVDLTCQSIWSGDSTMGIAIGSNAILTLETGLILDNLGLMSPDGRCYSFDKRSNGYARGEGVGALVIKPVNDAIRDGDTIRAVIRSSASNQDGRTPGITLPSMEMQETLIRDAYRKGGLDMADTRYFEAHGTGTAVGDPIESKAIGSIFRPFRSNEDPLYIGSVKSTIGHLEGAAGVAGLIKAVLALEKGIIPPQSTNFQSLNPRIDDEFLHIKIPSEPTPWPTNGLRRASVSSFGFGGSNSHIVLDDAYNFLRLRGLQGNHNSAGGPEKSLCLDHTISNTNGETNGATNGVMKGATNRVANGASNGTSVGEQSLDSPKLLVWSSADEKGITRIQDSWKSFLSDSTLIPDDKAQYLHDLSYTLGLRRTHFSWRSFVVARSSDKWAALPDNFASAARSITSPILALIFSGQGAQWHAMGRELLSAYPTFYESICSAGIYLKSIGCTWSALFELQKTESESNINKPEYSQTLTTAVQVALVDLLRSWNLVPQAVVGHSSGEIAAAYSAQAISRQSAWKIAFLRGKLSGWLAVNSRRKGTMLAVALTPEDACLHLEEINGQYPGAQIGIACVNSPKSLTISGDEQLIDILKAQLDEAEIFARKLKVGVAYHSHQMQEIAEEYRAVIGVLEVPSSCDRKFCPEMVSSVTGTWVDPSDLLSADYWVRNMVSPVLFLDALSALCASSGEAEPARKLDRSHRRHMPIHHLLEVGPHSVLQAPCKDILKSMKKEKTTTYLSMLVRNAHAVETALMAAGHLHCAGYPVDLSSVNISNSWGAKSLPNLPEYPFDHSKSYWHESQLSRGHRLRRFGRNDLLGIPDSNLNPLEARWRHFIRIHEMSWVEDHKVNETVLYPGMGMIVMAIEASKQIAEPGKKIDGFVVKDAIFKAAIRVPSNTDGIETGFYMRPLQSADAKSTGTFAFRLCTFENQIWTENCTGTIQVVYALEEGKEQDKRDAEVSRELLGGEVKRYHTVQQAAVTPMEDEAIYPFTEKCGLCYGEAFQLVTSLAWHRDDENSVTSNVRNFSTGKETIHPTTLDAIIQTGLWPSTKWGAQAIPTMVPTQVDKFWVSHDHLAQLSSDVLRAHAIRSEDPQQGISASIVAFDEQLKQAVVRVTGLRMNVVSSAEEDINQTTTSNEQRCHSIEWKPDLSLLNNDEITNLCISSVADQRGLDTFFTEVDFLLTARILQTLRNLPSKLKATQPHLTKYIDWMFEQKRRFDDGQVPYAFEPWRSRLDDEEYIKQVEERVINENSRGYLIASVARDLELFLTGELDPLGFLFQGDQMRNYYLEQLRDSTGLKRFSTYLDLLSHHNPQLRIVEVGAGTGSMTNIMLRSLGRDDKNPDSNDRRYAQWDYTDISRSFFGDAQDEFRAEGDRMRFRTLDIGLDPEGQGFEIGSYDVVVASLVLHATPDLRTTLTNARKLLKPGGRLILNEITSTSVIRTAFVFGLLEGWWLSSEPYRKFGPCVDREKWHELLQETGFSGLDVALSDYEDDRCHENSVLVSSAVEYVATSALQPAGGIEIIYDASEPGQEIFAQSLATLYHDRVRSSANCISIDQNIEVFSDSNSLRIFILEVFKPVLVDIEPEFFEKLQRLLCSTTDALWVNASAGTSFPHPHMRLSEGLLRVLAAEDDRKSCYLLSLEDKTNPEHQKNQITKVAEHLISRGSECGEGQETEFFEHNRLLNIPRLVSSTQVNDRLATQISPKQQKMQKFKSASVPLKLDAVSSGLIPGFKFIEDSVASDPLGDDEIEIEVKAAGVNFRDVLIAVGQLNSPHTGFECSGVVARTGAACERFAVGDRVAALAGGCFATYIRLKEFAGVVKISPSVSFSSAAAIPVNFATAYIALYDVARMRAGESILIHSAAGGTGQAAIQLAQNLGVTVYATVGSDEKRRFLREVYNIPESHIFSSRSTLFADAIKSRTNGRGVDAVFNSLAGESLRASWECIAPYGRFLEIGIKDILANDTLHMRQFLHNVSFSAINLASMMHDRPEMCAAALSSVFEMVGKGKLRPAQELHLYGIGEMEKAFRSMQSGKHIGKVVIEMREEDEVQTVLNTRPSTVLDSEATYVISGGLGGLGRNVAIWLADRGARNLLLLSRSGSQNPKAQDLVKELEGRNIRVLTPSCDIADPGSLREALEASKVLGMPPVKGCIQAAMVLRDALFESMSHASWSEALAPKVQGSWNLHRQLPSGMHFFIMLSSITGVFGSKGQANYAAGNTFQDALAAHRVALGEKATSIDLGLIGFTGAVVDDKRLQERLLSGDTALTPITEVEVHSLLDLYCSTPSPSSNTESRPPSQITLRITPNPEKVASGEVYWLEKSLFRHLLTQSTSASTSTGTESGSAPVAALLAQSSTLEEASDTVIQALMARLSKALSISMAELDANKPLHQYGVDSLVAVELRSWFAKDLKADVAVFDILGSATVESVGRLAAGKSALVREKLGGSK